MNDATKLESASNEHIFKSHDEYLHSIDKLHWNDHQVVVVCVNRFTSRWRRFTLDAVSERLTIILRFRMQCEFCSSVYHQNNGIFSRESCFEQHLSIPRHDQQVNEASASKQRKCTRSLAEAKLKRYRGVLDLLTSTLCGVCPVIRARVNLMCFNLSSSPYNYGIDVAVPDLTAQNIQWMHRKRNDAIFSYNVARFWLPQKPGISITWVHFRYPRYLWYL